MEFCGPAGRIGTGTSVRHECPRHIACATIKVRFAAVMPEFCTCGTQLVADALFCHKCGRPTRELVVPEVPPPPPVHAVPPPPRPEAPPLNFHNGVALRTSLLVAITATLLCFVPYLNFLNWLAAGFFAVYFYRRRTGYLLSMEAGIWMGWITGLLMFVFMAGVLTAAWLLFRSLGGFPADFKAAMDPKVLDEVTKLLQSGPDVAKMMLALFVYTTLLSMAGGALGAKMVGRD